MSNVTYLNQRVLNEMSSWRNEYYLAIVNYLAQQCTCSTKYISCIEVDPRIKPGYDPGFVFFGPNDVMLGEIRWNRRGECTDFLEYKDNILEVRQMIARKRAERARAKSVNSSLQEAKFRERPYRTGMQELAYFVKRNVKEVVATAAFVAVMATSIISMNNMLHPSYINDSYNSGYQAVNIETHRTNDNSGYWYDYSDIAGRYDPETMDFDSYVYGTYKNVGWNQESRIDCMENLFYQFKLEGHTYYSSFKDYCIAKGACKERNGVTVIDTAKFCDIMEEYMESLNVVDDFQNDSKGRNKL